MSTQISPAENYRQYVKEFSRFLWVDLTLKVPTYCAWESMINDIPTDQQSNQVHPLILVMRQTLFFEIVLGFCKLLDNDKTMSLNWLFTYCEKHSESIVPGRADELRQIVSKQLRKLKNQEVTYKKLKMLRDKYIAHFDKGFFLKAEEHLLRCDMVSDDKLYDLFNVMRYAIQEHEVFLQQADSSSSCPVRRNLPTDPWVIAESQKVFRVLSDDGWKEKE